MHEPESKSASTDKDRSRLERAYIKAHRVHARALALRKESVLPIRMRAIKARRVIDAAFGQDRMFAVRRPNGGVVRVTKTVTQTFRRIKPDIFNRAASKVTMSQLTDMARQLDAKRNAGAPPLLLCDVYHACVVHHLRSMLVVTNHSIRVQSFDSVIAADTAVSRKSPKLLSAVDMLLQCRAELKRLQQHSNDMIRKLRENKEKCGAQLCESLRGAHADTQPVATSLQGKGTNKRRRDRTSSPAVPTVHLRRPTLRVAPKVATVPVMSKPPWFRDMCNCSPELAFMASEPYSAASAELVLQTRVREAAEKAYVTKLTNLHRSAPRTPKLVIVRPRSVLKALHQTNSDQDRPRRSRDGRKSRKARPKARV